MYSVLFEESIEESLSCQETSLLPRLLAHLYLVDFPSFVVSP